MTLPGNCEAAPSGRASAIRQTSELFGAWRPQNFAGPVRVEIVQMKDRDAFIGFDIRSPLEIGERPAIARQSQIEIGRYDRDILDRPSTAFRGFDRTASAEDRHEGKLRRTRLTSHVGPSRSKSVQ